jgi:hypothetical protein
VPRLRLLIAALAPVLVAVACGGGSGGATGPQRQGQPRPFLMGVSSVPRIPTDDAYKEAFQLAGKAGDLVLVQRAPPWDEFVPGGTVSDRTQRLTRLERDLAKEYGLKLFLAVDATDPQDRGRLAGLPDDLRGADFSDGRVRSAFISYAKYLALNYKPAYMALGVEVDMYFNRRGDAAFRTFQSLYFQAYDAVKSVSPSTQVFPTFQYEDMQALLAVGSTIAQPAWSLVNRFAPKIDALAVSSFPGFVYGSPDKVPGDYFDQLKARFQLPLIIASTGWASGPAAPDAVSGESDQAAFLTSTLTAAERLGASVVVWYLGRDVEPPVSEGFQPLATSGLLRADGSAKLAWAVWRTYAERPVATTGN